MRVDSKALQQVYAQFPSLKVNADKGALEAAATKVLGAAPAKALLATLADKDTYLAARSEALAALPNAPEGAPLQQGRRAVVSGLSDGGILAAAVLASAGYQVEVLELRRGHTRINPLSSRQATVDGLASIDTKLAERFLELTAPPSSLFEPKVAEELLFQYLEGLPNVTIRPEATLLLGEPDDQGRYPVIGKPTNGAPFELGAPDLVVVSEGSSSALKIESVATLPAEQVIGESTNGRVAKSSDSATERILSMALGSATLNRTTEVKRDVLFDPTPGFEPGSDAHRTAHQALVERYFRSKAALVMETEVSDEGSPPTLLTLQQKTSSRATAGSNVLGLGDFVGNVERLKTLVFDLELGLDKGATLAKYNQGALEDSMAWGRRGIAELYPDVSPKKVSAAYVQAVTGWLQGKNEDPLAALEKLLAPVSEALPPIGKPAAV